MARIVVGFFGLALLMGLATTPVRADWQYTKWGMTPDEVLRASGNTLTMLPEAERKGHSRSTLTAILVGAYVTGTFQFDTDFQFSANRLEMVGLTLTHYSQCEALEDALKDKYGLPGKDGGDSGNINAIKWSDRKNRTTVNLVDIRSIYTCYILYERLDAAGAGGL